ncbi:MAG: flagellar hook-length control protein FliK, partial [Lachnospiraceae bacterium]|nr:flagellar hook-length control protein FliK [Lachnospiraceae bacterium]
MDSLSVKGSDISLQLTGSQKTGGNAGSGADDFRVLLQGKQENSQSTKDSKEIAKDNKDVDPGKDDVSNDTEKDQVSEDAGMTDKTEEPDSQTDGLMAAYQLSQGMRPEMIQIMQVTEEAAPEVMPVDTESLTGAGISEEAVVTQVQAEGVADVQPKQTADTKQQAGADTAEIRTADIQPAEHTDLSETKQETSDLASQLKDRGKTPQPEEELKVQPENTMAEAGVPVMAEAPRTERAEVPVYENVTTVHVEQPEELPQKVTDQLLSKLAEGATEFEIHIEPANLGKLAIKVLYEGGQATISIICSEKKAWEALGQNAREIGNIIDRNLGEESTSIVEKQ